MLARCRQVWFDDHRSVKEKASWIWGSGFRGVSFETAGYLYPNGGSSGRDSAEARAMWAATRSSSGLGKHTRLGLKTDEARTSLVPRKPPAEIAPFPPMQWHSW